jgi:hypothetical protein
MNWYRFILKIKPDGKAFRSIFFSKIFWEVLANTAKIIMDYAIFTINDQVWYTNDNFDPEPWEERYDITPSEFSTLDERRQVVKSYMLYPQSQNRLSRDYIYDTLISAGYEGVDIEYNSTGAGDGFLHANDFGDEKSSFSIGSLSYNSFIISGELIASNYVSAINLAMSLKPLQVALYDKVEVLTAIAIDDSLAWALDDTLATALTTL